MSKKGLLVLRRTILPLFLLGVGCSSLKTTSSVSKNFAFKTPSPKVASTLTAYQDHTLLPNGLRYGTIAQTYHLKHKTVTAIDTEMTSLHCQKKIDLIKNPKTNEPIVYQDKTLPLWSYLCPEGSVIRIKPLGDPTSKFRPQPHGNKALRFPYHAPFESFNDEVAKVSEKGEALPKSPSDMVIPALPSSTETTNFLNKWADEAHSDLAN